MSEITKEEQSRLLMIDAMTEQGKRIEQLENELYDYKSRVRSLLFLIRNNYQNFETNVKSWETERGLE